MQTYWTEDPTDVSMNEVCRRAGVSKASLYRGFGSDDQFMRAVLDRYAEQILPGILGALSNEATLEDTLDTLITFASRDPQMDTGCLFHKLRAGKHRLGPLTRQRVDDIEAAALQAFEAFLSARRDAGDWIGDRSISVTARYLSGQIGFALTQRAAGEDKDRIQETLELALSVLRRG